MIININQYFYQNQKYTVIIIQHLSLTILLFFIYFIMDLNYLITIENPIKKTHSVLFDTKHLIFANTKQVHIKKIDESDRYVRIKAPNYEITSIDLTFNKIMIGNNHGELIAHEITDLDKKKIVKGHYNQICSLATNNNLVASGSYDKLIKVWDLKAFSKPINVFSGHKNWITAIKFGNSNNLISGSSDKCLKVWDLEKKLSQNYQLDSQIDSIHCGPTGTQIYVATRNYLLVIDSKQKKIVQCFPLKEKALKIFDLKDNFLVTAHSKKLMNVFDIKKGQQIQSPEFDENLRCQNIWKYNQYLAILTQSNTNMYEFK